ncbi:MAG: hypothetical protein IJU95_00920 [Treponema sp.]|nr:hypothetical protein [Treponema sp.]
MKKSFLFITAFFFLVCLAPVSTMLFAQEAGSSDLDSLLADSDEPSALEHESVPALLSGIWADDSRYVVFDSGYYGEESGREIPNVVLRTFYQWYDDRAGEPSAYSAEVARDRNVAQTLKAEGMELQFIPLTDELYTAEYDKAVEQEDGDVLTAEEKNSGAWDIVVKYSGHKLGGEDTYHVPVAVIGDKLYLNFAIKKEDSDSVPVSELLDGVTVQAENLLDGYWQDTGSANGFIVCPPVTSTELLSYYVKNNAVYHIRYWETDMEYTPDAQALFTDGEATYSVPKHLRSAEKTYTCTLGRRTRIRNIEKSRSIAGDYEQNTVLVQKHATDSDGKKMSYTVRTSTILAFGKPYLTLTDGSRNLKDIIEENNARRHPAPASPFPPHGVLDFDWSIVEDPPASYDRRMLDLGK